MRKRVITYVVFAVCICAMSVLITYSIMHDNDEKQGEYEMEIEHTDKVETGTWSWNDEGYITLYQDNDAIANLVYVDGKYLFSDADVEIQELKRISETAIVK